MTSARTIPLGQREDLTHEWKSAAVLKEGKDKVVREVVAMLNAEGGEVWVGLGEESGYAVRVESVPDAEAERIRIRDRIADLIDPAPTSLEVDIEKVAVPEAEGGGAILLVGVTRPMDDRRPFALKSGEARSYLIRFGDRIRLMDRTEIFRDKRTEKTLSMRLLLEQAEGARRNAEGLYAKGPGLWLYFQPAPPLTGDLDELSSLRTFLADPARSENLNVFEWQSFVLPNIPPKEVGLIRRELKRNGILELASHLMTGPQDKPGVGGRELLPISFIPLVVSATRLGGALYREIGIRDLIVSLAVFGVRGNVLYPGDPFAKRLTWRVPPPWAKAGELSREKVEDTLEFSVEELSASPDRCAFRLIRRIYDAFGLDESAIPWWNPTSQRFELKR